MAAEKKKLVKQWISSVLVLLLLFSFILIAFKATSSGGGNVGNSNVNNSNGSAGTTTPDKEVLPDGIRLNYTELIF